MPSNLVVHEVSSFSGKRLCMTLTQLPAHRTLDCGPFLFVHTDSTLLARCDDFGSALPFPYSLAQDFSRQGK